MHEVVDERLVDVNRRDAVLQLGDLVSFEHRFEMFERLLRAAGAKKFVLVDRIRVADRQFHQETIELRFGKRIRSDMLDRILRRDDEEWIGKRQASLLDADHALAHRFEQRRLRFRRRTIDLVGEENIGEDRAGNEFEFLLILVVDRDADDVGGQKIARELNPLKRQRQRAGQRVRQRCLADSRNVFEKDVALGKERGDAVLHDFGFSADHTLDIRLQRGDLLEGAIDYDRFRRHERILNS